MAMDPPGTLQYQINGGWVRDKYIHINVKGLLRHLRGHQHMTCLMPSGQWGRTATTPFSSILMRLIHWESRMEQHALYSGDCAIERPGLWRPCSPQAAPEHRPWAMVTARALPLRPDQFPRTRQALMTTGRERQEPDGTLSRSPADPWIGTRWTAGTNLLPSPGLQNPVPAFSWAELRTSAQRDSPAVAASSPTAQSARRYRRHRHAPRQESRCGPCQSKEADESMACVQNTDKRLIHGANSLRAQEAAL